MLNTILGKKIEMSQTFIRGNRIPVTRVKAGPCIVTQIKEKEKDGYWSVQLGFGEKKTKNITKPQLGHLKAAYKDKKKAARFLREVRLDKKPEFKVGDEVKITDVFKVGDVVSVTATSKGKGFAGVVKRWGFAGGPRTHGQSDRPRSPGSIGQGTTPGRVFKGKKMAGRMGGERVTIKNLHVVSIDQEEDEIALSGPIPGTYGSLISIKRISAGSLEDLEQEIVAQIVEGEPEEEESKEGSSQEENQEEKKEEVKENE